MAFNAQFFQLHPQSSLADDISSGYKAGYEMREGERKKALNNIFSQSVKPDGSFDSERFLTKASAANVGPELVEKWLGQKTAKSDAALKESTNAGMMEMLGRKPDVLRDWFEQEKQKTVGNRVSEQGSGYTTAPDNVAPIDVDTLPNPDRDRAPSVPQVPVADKGNVTKTNDLAIESVPRPNVPANNPYHIPVAVAVDKGNELNLGQEKIIGKAPEVETFKTPDPGYYTEQLPDTIPQDKKYDVVEEALRKESGKGPTAAIGNTSNTATFGSDITTWEPMTTDTNEYRQFNSALTAKLNAVGIKSPSEYLNQVGQNTYKQNLYVPNPMAMYGKDGKLDMNAYGAEVAKFEQSKVVAQGKAEEAILKAKEALTEEANKYGVSTVDQRKLELPQGMILRDSGKRVEAAALITNRDNIGNAKTALKEAGFDTTKLGMAAPQVIRAYATALNPGQQLSEGNLVEVSKALYPDMSSKPEFLAKMAAAVFRGLKGDWTGFKQLSDYADAGAPEKVAQRMRKIAEEAAALNERNLANYVIKSVAPKVEKESEDKTSTPSAKEFAGAAPKTNPAPHKKTPKTETAAERYARLKGKK